MEYTVHQLKCFSIVKKQYLMSSWNRGMDTLCSTCPQLSRCFVFFWHTLPCLYGFWALFFYSVLFSGWWICLEQNKKNDQNSVVCSLKVHRTVGSNKNGSKIEANHTTWEGKAIHTQEWLKEKNPWSYDGHVLHVNHKGMLPWIFFVSLQTSTLGGS